MAEYDFIKMQKKLAKYLDEDRYEHTLGVMFTCAALAMVHDCDLITAQTAGLLHDCAKCIPNKKKLKMCSQHHISVSEFEQEHPFLLHAKLGAYVAKAKYDVTDENILSAITWHTTGKPEMTLLEKSSILPIILNQNVIKLLILQLYVNWLFRILTNVCIRFWLIHWLIWRKIRKILIMLRKMLSCITGIYT